MLSSAKPGQLFEATPQAKLCQLCFFVVSGKLGKYMEGADKSNLTKENQAKLDAVLSSYGEKKELKDHPVLFDALKERLQDEFTQFQKSCQKIEINRYALDAPSRAAVKVQIKQQSREKEK